MYHLSIIGHILPIWYSRPSVRTFGVRVSCWRWYRRQVGTKILLRVLRPRRHWKRHGNVRLFSKRSCTTLYYYYISYAPRSASIRASGPADSLRNQTNITADLFITRDRFIYYNNNNKLHFIKT